MFFNNNLFLMSFWKIHRTLRFFARLWNSHLIILDVWALRKLRIHALVWVFAVFPFVSAEDQTHNPHSFMVHNSKTSFYFKAESSQVKQQWIRILGDLTLSFVENELQRIFEVEPLSALHHAFLKKCETIWMPWKKKSPSQISNFYVYCTYIRNQ